MLPALTASGRRLPSRRVLLALASVALGVAAVASQISVAPQAERPAALADELRPASWAMGIPIAWLAAPVPRVRRGDLLDILAVRSGDRAYSVPVAYAVGVISVDDRQLVLEMDQDDAIAIANARGGGLLLIPLLRSTK